MIKLQILNLFFFVFHSAFVVFNLSGWIFKKTRKLHLITIFLTAFSWFVLGCFYQFGYCFLADWHFMVRQRMGLSDESHSFIHLFVVEVFGVNLNPKLVDECTLGFFIFALTAALIVNAKEIYSHHSSRK